MYGFRQRVNGDREKRMAGGAEDGYLVSTDNGFTNKVLYICFAAAPIVDLRGKAEMKLGPMLPA